MKYILSSDACILLKKRKLVIIYIICLMFGCVFGEYIANGVKVVFHILGLEISGTPFSLIMYVLNISFYAYFTTYLFINNIKKNSENVLSRLSKQKYIIYKIVSIVIVMFVLKIIAYLLVCSVLKEEVNYNIFLKDYLFTLIFDLSLLFILMTSKYSIITIMIIIMIFIISFWFPNIMLPMNNNLYYLIPLFIIVTILNILMSKFLFDFYERVK